MEPGNNSLPSTHWQVLHEIIVPCCHPIQESLLFWKKHFLTISNDILLFMTINILPFWCRVVMVIQCLEIPACSFMADVMFNIKFLVDICLVKEIHQFLGGYFLSKGQKINADFIHNVFINQE